MMNLRGRLQGALAQEVGEFLDMHALLLDDPELLHGLDELIRSERYSADYALRVQRHRIAAVFDGLADAYLRSSTQHIAQVIGPINSALHPDTRGLAGMAGERL